MSKTIISILVLVGVVVGGYYIINSNNKTQENVASTENEMNEVSTENNSGKKMAFSQFIKQGGSYKCTVNQYVGGTETKGITYIDSGLIRGEYNTKVANMEIGTTLIVRDGYTYSWTSMTPNMGFKAKVVESTEVNQNTGTSGTYSFNAEQIGDYDCEAWQSDASMFTVPTNITFQEV